MSKINGPRTRKPLKIYRKVALSSDDRHLYDITHDMETAPLKKPIQNSRAADPGANPIDQGPKADDGETRASEISSP